MQTYIITGLRPYQLVNVTITATNGGGTSNHSNVLSVRTEEAGMYDSNNCCTGHIMVSYIQVPE